MPEVGLVHFSSVIYGFTRLHVVSKKNPGKIFGAHLGFHCRYSIRKKPRVIILALPSKMM
jgi:hypothetical protein